jgi:hypothetical protein
VGLAGRTFGLVLCLLLVFSAVATPGMRGPVLLSSSGEDMLSSDTGDGITQFDWHLDNFTKTAQFFATLQGIDGGMNEAEDIAFENTDNTLESIWVWCRYYQLTGDNIYYPNVLNAWNYSIANPAWLEGDSGKVYSSAWALAAEQKFREVYNNWTFSWYGNASVWYIVNVSAWEPGLFNFTTKVHIRGWAAGNMYNYALDRGNETAKWLAVDYGNLTMTAIENDPTLLWKEGWALAGGTSMWGIWQSSMQEFPDPTWMLTYGPYLRTEVLFPGTGPGNSQVGWEAWYAGAHYGIWNITNENQYYLNFLDITDRQIAADGDDDGGLPTNYGEPDDTDESWVTSYRALMILDVFNKMPGGNAPEVADLQVTKLFAVRTDVMLTWSPSLDDGSGEMDVFAYEIYYSANSQACGLGDMNFTRLDVVFAGQNSYIHVGAGANQTNYVYYVATRDYEGWRTSSDVHGGKCALPLSPGMNLISIPFQMVDHEVLTIFQMVNVDKVWTFNSSDQTSRWRLFNAMKPFNTLMNVDMLTGIWINATFSGTLAVAGMLPKLTSIPIKTGWNLIGFPSMRNGTVGDVLSGISYDRVETYDATSSPYFLKAVGDSYLMQAGQAFWVHALADGAIQIQN